MARFVDAFADELGKLAARAVFAGLAVVLVAQASAAAR
jgi:hypothetical protein